VIHSSNTCRRRRHRARVRSSPPSPPVHNLRTQCRPSPVHIRRVQTVGTILRCTSQLCEQQNSSWTGPVFNAHIRRTKSTWYTGGGQFLFGSSHLFFQIFIISFKYRPNATRSYHKYTRSWDSQIRGLVCKPSTDVHCFEYFPTFFFHLISVFLCDHVSFIQARLQS
jgi:hypothetical protein